MLNKNLCQLFLAALMCGNEAAWAGELRVDAALVTLIEQVDVAAKEAGVLMEIDVREGQCVEAGATLARIDDQLAVLLARRVQTELDIARREANNEVKALFAAKSAEVARAELKRSTDSVEKYSKSISQTELDRLRLVVEKAELESQQAAHEQALAKLTVKQKEVEYETARHNVERCQIKALAAGVVVEIKKRQGEWVEPGMTVVRLVRIDRLRVEGFLAANDLTDHLVGAPVTLVANLPGRAGAEFTGVLVFVSPEINPVNGQVRVWAEVENRDQLLRPGMRASLVIGASRKP
ncbi:MAG: efflux RND transporter periplasmic adaptor subunit [Planctomycetes bacterium]|nr:efflux RND transporter periplasmic adaptor subunit [Planctomycetota bacterium]